MRIETLLERLKREFFKVNLIQSVVDSIILFLSTNLLLYLFSITLISGYPNTIPLLILVTAFFALDWFYRSRKYSLEIYEEKNPELKEKLRTARDSKNDHNVVARSLFEDVLDETRKMTSETIIPTKRILQKIVIIGVLSFLTVLSGVAGLQVEATSLEVMEADEIIDSISDDQQEEYEHDFDSEEEFLGETQPINMSEIQVDYQIEGEGTRIDEEFSRNQEPDIELGFGAYSDNLLEERSLALSYMRELRESQ